MVLGEIETILSFGTIMKRLPSSSSTLCRRVVCVVSGAPSVANGVVWCLEESCTFEDGGNQVVTPSTIFVSVLLGTERGGGGGAPAAAFAFEPP